MKLLFVLLFLAAAITSGVSHTNLTYNLYLFWFALSVYILPALVAFWARSSSMSGREVPMITFISLFIVADVGRYFYLPTLTKAGIPFLQDIAFLIFSLICLGGLILIKKVQNTHSAFSSFFLNSILMGALSVGAIIYIGYKIFLPVL